MKNIGENIKEALSTLIGFIGFVISLTSGIILCTKKIIDIGVCIIIFGTIFSVLTGVLIYGFGELIRRVEHIDDILQNQSSDAASSHNMKDLNTKHKK